MTVFTISTLLAYEGSGAKPLFAFHRPVGYSWSPYFTAIRKLEVASTDSALVTPLGPLTSLYRIDVKEAAPSDWRYGSFWLANGFGIVAYTRVALGKTKLFKLRVAKIRAEDGKKYVLQGADPIP